MTLAKVTVEFQDQTIQQQTQPLGIPAIAVQTQRGTPGAVYYLRSWKEWRENLGEIVNPTDTLGPILAKRVFDNGGQMYATRVVHYTDINDPNSSTPITATGNNGGVFPFANQIVSVDLGLNLIQIQGDFTNYITAGDVHVVQNLPSGTTNLTVAPAGATFAGGFTTIEYVSITLGDAVSGESLTWSSTLVASLNYKASSGGKWGNELFVEIINAASGLVNAVDIFVTSANSVVVGTDLNETFRDFPTTPSAGDFDNFNNSMKLLQLISPAISTPIGVVPANQLGGGTDDYASVTEVDYIGSTSASTGIRAFDQESGFVKIACPEIASNIVDNALLAYAKNREDCLPISRTPESLNARAAIDYRNAVGAYSAGTAIDDWRSIMLYGGIKVTSPYGPDNGAQLTISWIGDFLGLSAQKDNDFGPWFSVSGLNRGFLFNVRDIMYNINTPARTQEAEDLTNAGLFPIIKKKVEGFQRIISWGDTTLQRKKSVLQFANVAELLIYIANGVKPLSEQSLFDPNSILTWKTIYRKVDAFMLDILNRQGIEAYVYEGDQDVDRVSQAVVNTATTIADGCYLFNLYFSPIGSLRQVKITGVATEQGILITTEA